MNTVSLVKRNKLCGPGDHYGIYLNDDTCYDFHPEGIKKTDFIGFSHSKKVQVEKTAQISKYTSTRFTNFLKNHGKYDLFGNNCEHFARYVVEGERKSNQSTFIKIIGGVAVLFLLGKLIRTK